MIHPIHPHIDFSAGRAILLSVFPWTKFFMRFQILFLFILLLALPVCGQGSFSYVSYHLPVASFEGQSFDFNQDGREDLSIKFYSVTGGNNYAVFGYEGQLLNGARIVTGSYYFGNAVALAEGQRLDSVAIPVRTDMEPPGADADPYNWLGDIWVTGFSLGGDNGYGSSGIFVEGESIFGIQLLEDDGYHNGWMRFENMNLPETGPVIRVADWAYNLNAGEPILAGLLQVPEPQTWMLLVAGCLVLAGLNRTRSR